MKLIAIVSLCVAASAQSPPQRLTLAEAEQIALKNNPRIGAAESQAQASAQVAPQIRSAYYPTLSGSVTGVGAPTGSRLAAGGLNNPIIFSRFASGVTASQMITDFGRSSALARSADLHASAEFESRKATEADVRLSVNRAYLAGLRAQALTRAIEATIAARQQIVDHARALAESKLKSELDVRFAEVSLAEARLLLETASNDQRAAQAELAVALGYSGPRAFELVDEPPKELPSTDPARLISQALSKRPELAGRKFEVEAALKLVEGEKKLRFPTIGLTASVGGIPAYDEKLGNNHYAAGGVNISLPFLNGGLYRARRVEAEYKAVAARKRLDDLAQRIARDVTVALFSAQSAAERMALTDRFVEQSALALDLARARYELGLSSIVELSQAQIARTSAQIQKLNAQYDYQLHRAILVYNIGE